MAKATTPLITATAATHLLSPMPPPMIAPFTDPYQLVTAA